MAHCFWRAALGNYIGAVVQVICVNAGDGLCLASERADGLQLGPDDLGRMLLRSRGFPIFLGNSFDSVLLTMSAYWIDGLNCSGRDIYKGVGKENRVD